MRIPIDLSGRRFGRLIALHATDLRLNGSVVWECICDCGNTAYVSKDKLTSGNTSSCGCLRRENFSKVSAFTLLGKHFGKLTVLKATNKRDHGYTVWQCRCDCGNIIEVSTRKLTTGNISSCGCTE